MGCCIVSLRAIKAGQLTVVYASHILTSYYLPLNVVLYQSIKWSFIHEVGIQNGSIRIQRVIFFKC